jgi:hypothetical protein
MPKPTISQVTSGMPNRKPAHMIKPPMAVTRSIANAAARAVFL